MNEFRLSGVLIERAAMRFTPAGGPVLEAQIQHRCEVVEAGTVRTLEFVVSAVGLGSVAGDLQRQALGAELDFTGFLAPRSRRSRRLVLHLTGCRQALVRGAGRPVTQG
jgi:primosomal replication protein N